MKAWLWAVLTICSLGQPLLGEELVQDWKQWRGPHRNGMVESSLRFTAQSRIETSWEGNVGTGFSSPVVSASYLIAMGNIDDYDIVTALGAQSGEKLWEFKYASPLDPNLFEGGPTSTPAIHEERVVSLGRQGLVHCLDLKTGELLWKYDIVKSLKYNIPTWGFAGSPLIVDGHVFLNAGSHGVCLNLKDGELLWASSNDEEAGYSSPLQLLGEQSNKLLMMNAKSLNAVDAKDGDLLWAQRWITRYGINAADPLLVSDDSVLVSSGYGKGTGLVQFTSGEAELLWRTRAVRTQMSPGVLIEKAVYAIDGDEGDSPQLVCFSPMTGELYWSQEEFGTGTLVAANNQILVLGGSGELTVFEANTKEFQPILTKKLTSGKCWTPLVLVGNRIYSRNASGAVVCSVVQ